MPVVADVDVVGLLEEVRRHIAKAENAIARVLQGPEGRGLEEAEEGLRNGEAEEAPPPKKVKKEKAARGSAGVQPTGPLAENAVQTPPAEHDAGEHTEVQKEKGKGKKRKKGRPTSEAEKGNADSCANSSSMTLGEVQREGAPAKKKTKKRKARTKGSFVPEAEAEAVQPNTDPAPAPAPTPVPSCASSSGGQQADSQGRAAWVVLRNCDAAITDEDVRRHFAPLGPSAVQRISWLRQAGTQEKAGIGFVRFESSALAKRAVEELADGLVVGRRRVTMELDSQDRKTQRKETKREDPNSEVFIGNCDWGTTDEHVHQFFDAKLGQPNVVESIRWACDAKGQFRGFGFIRFRDRDLANQAAGMKRVLLRGRQCDLSLRQSA